MHNDVGLLRGLAWFRLKIVEQKQISILITDPNECEKKSYMAISDK